MGLPPPAAAAAAAAAVLAARVSLKVSGFGDNGEGDAGDDWELMVREKGDVYDAGWGGPWMRDSIFRLKHVVTGQYLFSHRKSFNNGPVEGTCTSRYMI